MAQSVADHSARSATHRPVSAGESPHGGGQPHAHAQSSSRGTALLGPFAPSSWTKKVISAQGQRDTSIVSLFRLASALFMGGALVSLGLALGAAYDGEPWDFPWWLLAGGLALLSGIFAYGDTLYGGRAALREEKRIRAKLLERSFAAASLPKAQGDAFGPARLIQLMTDYAERTTQYRQRFSGTTRASFLIPFLTLAFVAIFFDVVTGVAIMAICPLIPLALVAFMRLFRKTSAHSRRERARLADKYLDAIRNLSTIRLMGAGGRIEAQLREAGESNRGAIMKLLASNQLVIIVIDGVFSLVLIVVGAAITVARYHAGALSTGQAISVVLLMVLMIEPLAQVAGFFYVGMGGKASMAAIGRYLTAQQTAASAARRAEKERSSAAQQASLYELNGEAAVCVRSLSYDYGRGPVLKGINLDVPRGAKVVILGPSGSGKSTLLSLVRGSLPLQEGEICIDGIPLSSLPASEVRKLSASVSQTTWLFTGTVADNLRLACPKATEEEMWQALRQANVADDIERMPRGLETDLGESGALISGGQAQRISLARALLSGRQFLLLDEPTSQVDIESEQKIVDALSALGSTWTLLIATHRRSLVDIADAVYEMVDGQLVPFVDG